MSSSQVSSAIKSPEAPAALSVWEDLAEEFEALSALARSAPTPGTFYRELLRRAVAALAATGGAVWTSPQGKRLQQVTLIDDGQRPTDDGQRRAHEGLLRLATQRDAAQTFAPRSSGGGASGETPLAANLSENVLLVAPVFTPCVEHDPATASEPIAIIELSLRPGVSPSLYQGAEQALNALREIAAEYHVYRNHVSLQTALREQQSLLTLAERVHRGHGLRHTAYVIVNEAREAIGCDRVSLLASRGQKTRLLAVSGVERPERRSRTVRGLERLGWLCRRLGEPLYWVDGQEDALPESADALHAYADASHARQIILVPMCESTDDDLILDAPQHHENIAGVLVAEQFDGAGDNLARDRVIEAAAVCSPALRHAQELRAAPFGSFAKGMVRGLFGWLLALGLLAAVAGVLFVAPAEFHVEARGQLQPISRHDVFAPRSGLVQHVAVDHGERVEAGQLLIELRDPELELDIKRLDGETTTLRGQLDAVRATRTSLNLREAASVEAYRLSAEEQRIERRLDSLLAQRTLLRNQRESLQVLSPHDGMVVTWRVEETLLGRPIERGQVLLTVADTASDWRLELEIPDDRIGYVIEAQRTIGDPSLPVEYRLGSEETGFATGRVTRVAQRAEEPTNRSAPDAQRTVLVYVDPDDSLQANATLRPGLSARARILCGRRSLGYVWLHDLWNTIKVWWEF